MTVHPFPLYQIGKTTLFQMKDMINPSHIVTLNVLHHGRLVISSTVPFARIENAKDEVRDDLMVITNTTANHIFLSMDAMDNYILDRVGKTANGYDHQYFFHYSL